MLYKTKVSTPTESEGHGRCLRVRRIRDEFYSAGIFFGF